MKITKGTIILAVMVVLLCLSLDPMITSMNDIVHYQKGRQYYQKGEYEQAIDYLETYLRNSFPKSESERIQGLAYYSQAHLLANDGNYIGAEQFLSFAHHRGYRPKSEREFVSDVMEKYEVQWHQEWIAQREAEEAEYQRRVKTDVPFEGMYERDIDRTTLGKHSETWSTSNVKRNKRVFGTTYAFIKDGGIIFLAHCEDGVVDGVNDFRQRPWYRGGISKESTSSKSVRSDPYNAKDYGNADDFYEDNYDDFFDYEDAEEYWEEHQ